MKYFIGSALKILEHKPHVFQQLTINRDVISPLSRCLSNRDQFKKLTHFAPILYKSAVEFLYIVTFVKQHQQQNELSR